MTARTRAARALAIVANGLQRLSDRVAFPVGEGPTLAGDRDIEWSWCAVHLPPVPSRILDFGAGSGVLSIAAALAGHDVVSVDLEPCAFRFVTPQVQYRGGDLLELEWDADSFDQIVNCSTIEHVGLSGRYGSVAREDGDLAAMAILRSLLRPAGQMILTLPVGRGGVFAPAHRVYDAQRLDQLCSGLTVEAEQFWAKLGTQTWQRVPRAVALAEQGSASYYALGLFVLRKAQVAPR